MIEKIIKSQLIFDSTAEKYLLPLLAITILLTIGVIIYEKHCSKNNC